MLPALRADSGQDWFGCRGQPNGLSSALRDEDLVWLRVAETLLSLTKQGRVWTVAFEVLSDVMPIQMLGMTEVLENDGVERQLVKIRCITIMVITCVWTSTVGEHDYLEELYMDLTGGVTCYHQSVGDDGERSTGIRMGDELSDLRPEATEGAGAEERSPRIDTGYIRDHRREAKAWRGL